MASFVKCPECGGDLVLCVDECITIEKKILKDGKLHKVTNRSSSGPAVGLPYLKCYKCLFSYDVEHASHNKEIIELDDWIDQHLEEIYQVR